MGDAVWMADRIGDGDLPGSAISMQVQRIKREVIYNRFQVQHARVQREIVHVALGQSRPSCVVSDQPRLFRQSLMKEAVRRNPPFRL
ncbi:MAG: hypothetical protein Q8Q00_14270 [Dehalococcoidia bacterium]|nr:hypothetical protein [Dehalococcoidia bacterium]